jgi:inosose dehydratase
VVTDKVVIGTAPDSWGIWFADDPNQTPADRFLDEVVQAGYEWIEIGAYGYLSTDPAKLRDDLSSRRLKVSGGTNLRSLTTSRNYRRGLGTCRTDCLPDCRNGRRADGGHP